MTHPSNQPTKLGEPITVTDDYDGVEFTYIYEGGPVRRFRNEENRRQYYERVTSPSQTLELLEFLFDKNCVQTAEEAPYAVLSEFGAHAIPEHLHRLFDDLRGEGQ